MTLGDVETFISVTPTVYIRVDVRPQRMSWIAQQLNTEALAFTEEWPYIPHLTDCENGRRSRRTRGSCNSPVALEPVFRQPPHPAGRLTFVREECAATHWSIWPPVMLGRAALVSLS